MSRSFGLAKSTVANRVGIGVIKWMWQIEKSPLNNAVSLPLSPLTPLPPPLIGPRHGKRGIR